MFLFHGFHRVLLVLFALVLAEYGILTKGPTRVIANGNNIIQGPFLHILKSEHTKILITPPNAQYELDCEAILEDFKENDTSIFAFTWYQNDTILELGDGSRKNDFYQYDNGTLRLPASEKASGTYRCQINAGEIAFLSESIVVEYPVLKRLPHVPTNVTMTAGKSFTLNCPVHSVPRANITWFVGNQSSAITLNENNRYLLLANGSLVIRRATINDIGKYRCTAYNQYSNKPKRPFTLSTNVVTKNGAAAVKPNLHLIPYLQNAVQHVPMNSHCILLCYALMDGSPIEWWFQRTLNSPLIKLSNNSHEYRIDYASVEDHEGHYTCNLLGTHENQTFAVIVTIPPIIPEPLHSYQIFIASSMTFRCRSLGNPRPQISWYHNGARLNSSYTRYINNNELVIHSFDPEEGGIYQCFARNIAGETSTAAEMRYKRRGNERLLINPFKNIRCYAHSFNTINITFDSQPNEYYCI